MAQYVVERSIPGIETNSEQELKRLAEKWSAAADALGPAIQWVQSYVVGGKVFCVYRAKSADLVREHARLVGEPESSVSECSSVLLPALAG